MKAAPAIRTIEFRRDKYGVPLLVDVGAVESLDGFIQHPEPHALTFHELMFVTGGEGELQVDGRRHEVKPRETFVTRAGQVRRWDLRGPLRAVALFFEAEVVAGLVSDPASLGILDRDEASMPLAARHFDACLATLAPMLDEMRRVRPDSGHFLRASVYQLLVLLNRHGQRPLPTDAGADAARALERELAVRVERHFREHRSVADYASMLGVTPEHLTRTLRRRRGVTAGDVIERRVVLEAKRLLAYSDATVAEIAYALGFREPSYFNRFFKRTAGSTPGRYRDATGARAPRRRR